MLNTGIQVTVYLYIFICIEYCIYIYLDALNNGIQGTVYIYLDVLNTEIQDTVFIYIFRCIEYWNTGYCIYIYI